MDSDYKVKILNFLILVNILIKFFCIGFENSQPKGVRLKKFKYVLVTLMIIYLLLFGAMIHAGLLGQMNHDSINSKSVEIVNTDIIGRDVLIDTVVRQPFIESVVEGRIVDQKNVR